MELNLIQKLAKIRMMTDVVSKNKNGYNYKYTDINAILANVTAGMKKYKVSLIPCVNPNTVNVSKQEIKNTKMDKQGNIKETINTEMLVTGDMVFTWVNDDKPDEVLKVPWFITGSQADPSQAFGSGLSYCVRYFLINFFQIAQPNSTDVDAYRSKQKMAEAEEEKSIAEEIVSKIDIMVRQYLADNPSKSDDVKRFISKYTKDGNYLAIKDPDIAGTLLENFKNKFNKEDIK